MASLSQEEENYVRMSLLLTGISPRAARNFFNQEFAPVCLDSSLKKEYNKLLELKKTHRINQLQWNLLFPRFPDVVDSKTFDINLMITLLRNLTNMYPPNGGFDCLPTQNETTPGADLARIKYYRNYLAHLDEGKVKCSEFNSAWESVSEAIGQLGGQQLKLECDQLKTKTLDQTNTEIMMDIKRANDEIKELKESLNSLKQSHEALQDEHAGMTKEIQRLKTCQENTVSWNVRAKMKDTLKAWKDNDEKMFINTRAAKQVVKCIKENSCVTITASSGVGKTAILRHTALTMAEEKFDILIVTDPGDILKFYNPNKKTLFVVDDLCGNFSVDQIDIKSWEPVMNDIIEILAKKQAKILGACRLQVYRDEKFESLSIFNNCVCNLLSEDMCLLNFEKESIAELYLKTESYEIVMHYNLYDCFPLLCKLYHDNPKLNVNDFFENPFSVYDAEIDKLKKRHYTKYCALVICVMFNNELEAEILTDDVNGAISNIIANTCEACKLDRGTSRLVLLDELDSLQDTFIKKEKNMYKIIHDKIFDFLAYFCGQKMIDCLIKNADRGLIKERFVFKRENWMDQFIIIIPPKYHQMYIQRMIDDWSNGNVQDVFNNINMKIPSFRQEVLIYLNTLNLPYQRQLAHICEKRNPLKKKLKDCNDVDDGDTVLIKCCISGDVSLTQWCCKFDADFNKCNYYNQSPVMKACEYGHIEIVKMLIDRKVDCNRCDTWGPSPLMKACERGRTEVVQMLLDKGVDFNNFDLSGQSPVIKACKDGYTKIAKMLLDRGVNYNKNDLRHVSIVRSAILHGRTEMVQLLLDKGADCNKCDKDGYSPLINACRVGHTEIFNMLLDKGADCNKCDKDGQSPLMMALRCGHSEIFQILLERKVYCDKYNCVSQLHLTCLMNACIHGHIEIVQLLLDEGADCNKCDEYGQSPLLIACEYGNTEIVRLLVTKGADYNRYDEDSYSPLIVACVNGFTNIVQLLVSKGADCNRYDEERHSPLLIAYEYGHTEIIKILYDKVTHLNKCKYKDEVSILNACQLGETGIVKMLLERRVDFNKCNRFGQSPLLVACINGHTEIVQLLIDKGADCNKCDTEGQSPFKIACEYAHTDIVKLLSDGGVDLNKCNNRDMSSVNNACKKGHTEKVKVLKNRRANYNKCYNLSQSHLIKACQEGQTATVKVLLEFGVNYNECGRAERSLVSVACEQGYTDIVQMLIEYGADYNKCDIFRRSPLMKACMLGHTEIAKLLLDRGADFTKRDEDGQSSLMMACKYERTEIVKILKNSGADYNQCN